MRGKKNDGKSYEAVTKAIFQSLLNQTDVKNIEVVHDVTLSGKTVDHQVDVYWEFEMIPGVVHRTAVECRDWNQRISQEKMMAFKKKLEDLNDPTGIMVTRTGYQSGALEFAKTHGVFLYELYDEPSTGPTVVKEGSFGTFALDQHGMMMEFVYYETKVASIRLVFDGVWVKSKETELGVPLMDDLMNIKLPPQIPSQFKIYDEHFNETGNMLQLFLPFAEEMFSEKEGGLKSCEHIFDKPAFLKIGLPKLTFAKIFKVLSDVTLIKHPPRTIPLKVEGFAAFILKNLQDDSVERHLIKR